MVVVVVVGQVNSAGDSDSADGSNKVHTWEDDVCFAGIVRL